MATFLLMFCFGGFFGIIGGIRYLKAQVQYRKHTANRPKVTEKDLERVDLDYEAKRAQGEKIIADWQAQMHSRPDEAPRGIRIVELKLEKIQENYEKERKEIVEKLHNKGGPSIRSVAYWAGGGIALGFFVGAWMTSMVSHT